VERADEVWRAAAEAYVVAKRATDKASATLDAAKSVLAALATHPKEAGFGVAVMRFWKAGTIDYKRIPELKGVDLERYRGAEAGRDARVNRPLG